MSCSWSLADNIQKADGLVRQAAAAGAQIILLQELFATPYFCQKEKPAYYRLACEAAESSLLAHFQALARELAVVLPISFYEKHHNALYNSVAIFDADGSLAGIYRKSHIPDGPGYEEKFYFNPGDTGFRVWDTRYARIGVGICWDQWFPEAARCMALQGAELLFYPTAIGSEPDDPTVDSKDHWQMCMRGHAAANLIPVIAANRIGSETDEDSTLVFYGSSFITGPQGQLLAEADRCHEGILTAEFDRDELAVLRAGWGIYRDRRPDLYRTLLTYDGEHLIAGI
jgi:N-carbamoylputrescine amidase